MRPSLPANLEPVLRAVRRVGTPYLVGGCVRDWLLGLEPADIDIEVYGTGFDKLRETLARFGPTDVVGKSFGVVKLRLPDAEYDFALPRRERKTSSGHRGFAVEADGGMTVEEASSRRDFTINAMAWDPETGCILDPHGGRADLEKRILRHIGPAFAEDPLRVLRAMQLAGRHDLRTAPETAALSRRILDSFHELPIERVWAEWDKWARLSTRPSRGLAVLRETAWLGHFPELAAIDGVPQEPEWHPEGDVLTHTGHALDALAGLPGWREAGDHRRRVLMLAVLSHDLGKATTTRQTFKHGRNRWTSPGHDREGGPLAAAFLASIGAPPALRQEVVPLVENHMFPLQVGEHPTATAVRRLAGRLHPATIGDLALVVEADAAGRPPLPPRPPAAMAAVMETARGLRVESKAPRPLILGRHLIAAGLSPGPHFKPLLNELFEAQLEGDFTTEEEGLRLLRAKLAEKNPPG